MLVGNIEIRRSWPINLIPLRSAVVFHNYTAKIASFLAKNSRMDMGMIQFYKDNQSEICLGWTSVL